VLPSARGALARGVAYVVPAVVVAAATLQGEAQVALVAASVLGWGLAQGGGALAYTVLNRSPAGSGLRPLRRAFVASTAVILAAGLAIGGTATPAAGGAFALPLLYLVASCGLIMAGRTWRLLALLTPTTGLSIAALARPGLELAPLVFPSAAATVAVALLLVVREAGGFGAIRRGRAEGAEPARRPQLLFAGDWLAAVPMVACGLASAGCAVLSVRALARVDGLVGAPDRVWLLLALPLWAMVVGNEWLLMRMRRSLRALLHTSVTVAGFRGEGLWIVTGWLAGGAAALAGTVLVAMAVAGLPVLAAWQVSSVFLHVSLAFVGVTVLYTAPRVVPALVALGATLVTLAGVVLTPWAPLGLADHTLALATCATAAAVLCATAARTLTDPAAHR
jgi:hypothetical protein